MSTVFSVYQNSSAAHFSCEPLPVCVFLRHLALCPTRLQVSISPCLWSGLGLSACLSFLSPLEICLVSLSALWSKFSFCLVWSVSAASYLACVASLSHPVLLAGGGGLCRCVVFAWCESTRTVCSFNFCLPILLSMGCWQCSFYRGENSYYWFLLLLCFIWTRTVSVWRSMAASFVVIVPSILFLSFFFKFFFLLIVLTIM